MDIDKTAPIRDIWTMLNSNLAKHYKPTEHLTIEKQLYPYGVKLNLLSIFHQSQPSLELKYGGYVMQKTRILSLDRFCTGKLSAGREKNVGERVVKDLVAP